MIRDRLHDLGLKITELAGYLGMSRTTLYKFIEDYDAGKKESIGPRVVALFDYVSSNPLIGKENVIEFILMKIRKDNASEDPKIASRIATISDYVSDNPDSEKANFLFESASSTTYDTMIHYLTEIKPLLSKKRLTKEEKEKLKPYQEIIDRYAIAKGAIK